jgi:hypothetical protein
MAADILILTKSRFQRRLTAPTLEREVSQKALSFMDNQNLTTEKYAKE